MGLKIRKNAIQIKQEIEEAEKELLEQEKFWENILKQHQEIDALNKKLNPFKILKGIESDIKTDGSLDYPEDILKSFDIIVASIHQGFKIG